MGNVIPGNVRPRSSRALFLEKIADRSPGVGRWSDRVSAGPQVQLPVDIVRRRTTRRARISPPYHLISRNVTTALSQNCPRRLLRRPGNIPHSVQTRTLPYQPPTRGRHPVRTPDRGTPDDPIPGLRAFSPAIQTRSFQIANQDS